MNTSVFGFEGKSIFKGTFSTTRIIDETINPLETFPLKSPRTDISPRCNRLASDRAVYHSK